MISPAGMFSRAGLSTTNNGGEALLLRMVAGLTSGSFAICVAQPMDVVKIRMQAGAGAQVSCDWSAAGDTEL